MNAEVLKLDCACGETIEIPPAARRCPKCGVHLEIDWYFLHTESAATKPAAVRPFEHPAVVLRRAYEREKAHLEMVYGVPGGEPYQDPSRVDAAVHPGTITHCRALG